MAKTDHLFVYGTLRIDWHPMHLFLAQHAELIGMGKFRGKLYNLGRYPGAVVSKKASDQVIGQVYALRESEKTLSALDRYEGPEFHRQKVAITLVSGRKLISWIYLYRGETSGLKLIALGDYLRFRHAIDANDPTDSRDTRRR